MAVKTVDRLQFFFFFAKRLSLLWNGDVTFYVPINQVVLSPKIVCSKNSEFGTYWVLHYKLCVFDFGPYELHIIMSFSKMARHSKCCY
jgi:hypothetical protein